MHNPNLEPPELKRNTGVRGLIRFFQEPSLEPLIGGFVLLPVAGAIIANTKPSPESLGTIAALLVAEVGLVVHAARRLAQKSN